MSDWRSGDPWRPDEPDDDAADDSADEGDAESIEIRVITPHPVPLRIESVERDEIRDGERAFATYIDGAGAPERPIAVNSLPAEVVNSMLVSHLFDLPRHLMAQVHEDAGGLRGLLSALVPADEVERWARAHDADDDAEPWKASVPAMPSFEAESEDDGDDGEPTAVVPIPLGVILRFKEHRKHPDDVVQEAADLVASVLGGFGMDAKQKRIEDLLGGL